MAIRGVQYPRPGMYGLRTQSSIVESENDLKFASVALNAVIGESGKLTCRKHFTDNTGTGSRPFESIYIHTRAGGTQLAVAAGTGIIGTAALPGVTFASTHNYSGTSTTLNSWQFAGLSGKVFGFQAGVAPFVFDEGSLVVESFTGAPWTQSPNVIMAGSGRLWAADDAAGTNRHTLWWSNLLDGKVWNAGDAGNLDVREVWPGGQDSIIAVALAQDRLIIFGLNNILLYTLPADRDPANMTLTDALSNIGCIARDSVCFAGGDLYFLAHGGYYKIPRLAQVTSLMSLVEVTHNISDEFSDSLAGEDLTKVRAGFNPSENLLLLALPTSQQLWCFHTSRMVPTDTEGVSVPAVTLWSTESEGYTITSFASDKDGNFYGGLSDGGFGGGLAAYGGFNGDFDFEFDTLWNTMQDETRLKNLKDYALTVEAASGQTGTFRWKQDYKEGTERTSSFTCSAAEFAEDPGLGVVHGQLGGSCNALKSGFTFPIAGDQVTVHSKRIYATPGRTNPR